MPYAVYSWNSYCIRYFKFSLKFKKKKKKKWALSISNTTMELSGAKRDFHKNPTSQPHQVEINEMIRERRFSLLLPFPALKPPNLTVPFFPLPSLSHQPSTRRGGHVDVTRVQYLIPTCCFPIGSRRASPTSELSGVAPRFFLLVAASHATRYKDSTRALDPTRPLMLQFWRLRLILFFGLFWSRVPVDC